MPSPEEITQQLQLLATYRRTLADWLTQEARFSLHTPPYVNHGIRDTREQIQRVKGTLRQWGVIVEDHPDDSGITPPQSGSALHPPIELRATAKVNKKSPNRRLKGLIVISSLITIVVIVIIYAGSHLQSNNIPKLQPTQINEVASQTLSETVAPVPLTPMDFIETPTLISNNSTAISLDWRKIVRVDADWNPYSSLNTDAPFCTLNPYQLPANINPVTNPSEALKEIQVALESGELFDWTIVGHYLLADKGDSDGASLFVRIKKIVFGDEMVTLSNTISFTVTSHQKPEEPVNAVSINPCAGFAGGVWRTFPPILLQYNTGGSYSNKFKSDDNNNYYTLSRAEFETFRLFFECKSVGTYIFNIGLPFNYLEKPDNIAISGPAAITCPDSFTLWNIDPGSNTFIQSTQYRWDGIKYIATP